MKQSLLSYTTHLALPLIDRQMVVRGAAPGWLSGQGARRRTAANQGQASAPGLLAHMAASSLSYVSTYAFSFFLALRANSFRRGVLGI
ncbi:MAG TPA: hypothetical protein VME63_11640 [Dyella sp.]|uniref:hypothetical protein n=1 Tax=Dyella sp. TaxID=1869338 RepID=UPI002C0E855C|nr:hypothetical protein [Dyella sp.]HTV86054.1 hypothetical protein [Dyella sp.]